MPVWAWFVIVTAAAIALILSSGAWVARKNRRESEAMLAENKAAIEASSNKLMEAVENFVVAAAKRKDTDP